MSLPVSLRLEPGRRVALLGASGAGKTTVVNLLLRFLDPERGRVTLAERDLRDYRQEDVRRLIAVAGQDSHLFSTSIRDNVRLARPEASDAEIEQALRRARLWHWVTDQPDGLDTPVGELGVSSRAASGSGSSSLARCSPTPPCWCSTSRPPTSTRRPRSGCWRTSSARPATARCC